MPFAFVSVHDGKTEGGEIASTCHKRTAQPMEVGIGGDLLGKFRRAFVDDTGVYWAQ